MKEGTKVKVVACRTDHGFIIGEIVERRAAEYDEEQDSLGFYSEDSGLWYMQPNEYEIVDKNYTTSLMVDAMDIARNQQFSRDVWEWGRVAAAIEQEEEELAGSRMSMIDITKGFRQYTQMIYESML